MSENPGISAGESEPTLVGPDSAEPAGEGVGDRPPAEAQGPVRVTEIALALDAWLQGLNESDPPDFDVPWMLHNFRHACPEARGAKVTGKPISTALECKERYVRLGDVSGAFGGLGDSWAIVFREGSCALCKATGRSLRGHVVNTVARPPLEGRVAR